MSHLIQRQISCVVAAFLGCAGVGHSEEPTQSSPAPSSRFSNSELPRHVAAVMQKFADFERELPGKTAWQAKRLEVLKFLKEAFDQETKEAHSISAAAIKIAATSLFERTYDDVKLSSALASLIAEGW